MRVPRPSISFLSCLVIGACAAGGCQSRPAPLDRADDALVLLEQQPARGSISAGEMFGRSLKPARFAEFDGDGQPVAEFMIENQATQRFSDAIARADGPARTIFLRWDAQGNAQMIAALDRQEQALSEFEPPLMMMPAELRAREPHTSKAAMRILDSEDPKKRRESGEGTRVIEYVSDQRIRSPLGEHIVKRIDVTFTADLRLADVQEHVTMWVLPGTGIIAERSEETVKVLGAFSQTKRRTLLRLDH